MANLIEAIAFLKPILKENWEEAIELYKRSKAIYAQHEWSEDINYAKKIFGIAQEKYKKEEEEEEKRKRQKILSFRGTQIPQFEAEVLKELEKLELPEPQFSLVNEVSYDTKMGFSVENNRITGIGLSGCGVLTLPESIGNLTSLETLGLEYNQLRTLPESIGQLSSLQTLWINNNQLRTLPESIGNLTSLKELWLIINQLTTLPESIGNLSSLKELILYNNKLTTLPESMTTMSSLKVLYISGNPLDRGAKSVLKQLKKKGVNVNT